MKTSFLIILFCLIIGVFAVDWKLIRKINKNPASTWKAGPNPVFDDWSRDKIKGFFRSGSFGTKDPAKMKPYKPSGIKLPDSFDPRVQWPNCTSMSQIRDQAKCGSCWAFGAVESFTDRVCVAFKQQANPILSAQYMVTCDTGDGGCEGGDPMSAYSFIASQGLPLETCQPYNIPTCPPAQEPCLDFVTTPDCIHSCYGNQSDNINNRYFAQDPYYISNGEDQMKQDLYQYGPIEVCFTVYDDFLAYKSGVYSHQSGDALGGHCVKMLGWGSENGNPYWLCANSWTNYWGDQGYFKIARGNDECGIESDVVAALPQTSRKH